MGKDFKGRECGVGICQRKDGLFSARYTNLRTGKRVEKHFKTLQSARYWLAKEKAKNISSPSDLGPDITLNGFFPYWIETTCSDLRPSTIDNYSDRFNFNIAPEIGDMPINAIKSRHCQEVLAKMVPKYAGSTIIQTYETLGTILKVAKMNDLIDKHPFDGIKKPMQARTKKKIRFLSIEEEKSFFTYAQNSIYCPFFLFLVKTGLRVSEAAALTWDDIDWEKGTITVSKILYYHSRSREWIADSPKTFRSYRTISVTAEAIEILKELQNASPTTPTEVPNPLPYTDIMTGEEKLLDFKNLIFRHPRTGLPVKTSTYDSAMYRICDMAGLKRASVHAFRHTFATRWVEAGLNIYALRDALGHSSILTTVNLYVHSEELFQSDYVNQLEEFNRKFGLTVIDGEYWENS